jgi:hypothetical protein
MATFACQMLNDLQQRVGWLLDVVTIEGEHATLRLDIHGEPFLEGEPVPYFDWKTGELYE